MIYLVYATIRPEVFIENYNHWMATCSNKNNVKVKVAVNTKEEKEKLKYLDMDVIVTNSPKIGYCFSMNYLTKQLELEDNDILIFLADDIYSPDLWDLYILNKFKDFNGCLHLDDGFQTTLTKDSGIYPSLNIPAMTFNCLKKINKQLFSSNYVHFFADNELYINMVDLGLLKDDRVKDQVIFEHRHYWINGKRERDKYDVEYCKYSSQDKEIFEKRKMMTIIDRIGG